MPKKPKLYKPDLCEYCGKEKEYDNIARYCLKCSEKIVDKEERKNRKNKNKGKTQR